VDMYLCSNERTFGDSGMGQAEWMSY